MSSMNRLHKLLLLVIVAMMIALLIVVETIILQNQDQHWLTTWTLGPATQFLSAWILAFGIGCGLYFGLHEAGSQIRLGMVEAARNQKSVHDNPQPHKN